MHAGAKLDRWRDYFNSLDYLRMLDSLGHFWKVNCEGIRAARVIRV